MIILVLGHRGMLGSTVTKYFTSLNFEIKTIESKCPTKHFEDKILTFKGDYIINCIGAIPQRTKDFKVNTDLPIWLSNNAPCRVIHPGTDCEMDTDVYGVSKRLAREYLECYSVNTKVLQTSIIGHEQGTSFGLLEWFLAQQGEVKGYTEAMWNGITTLEWAIQASNLIKDWSTYKTVTVLESEPISKYNLLSLIKEIYNKQVEITPVSLGKNKCLVGDIKTKSLKDQLLDLKNFHIL